MYLYIFLQIHNYINPLYIDYMYSYYTYEYNLIILNELDLFLVFKMIEELGRDPQPQAIIRNKSNRRYKMEQTQEQETEQEEYMELGTEEVKEEPSQNDTGLPTSFSIPEITMDDIFDTSLLPAIYIIENYINF